MLLERSFDPLLLLLPRPLHLRLVGRYGQWDLVEKLGEGSFGKVGRWVGR